MDGTTTGDGPMVEVSTIPQGDGTTKIEVAVEGAPVACVQMADSLDPEAFAATIRHYVTFRVVPLPAIVSPPPDLAADAA